MGPGPRLTNTLPRHYTRRTVPVTGEPLDVSVRLAEAGPYAEHVVYERDGEFAYAGGVLAEVVVDRDGARTADRSLDWHDQPLTLVRALLAGLPVRGWRAYGWLGFELAYPRAELPAGQRLAHLMVPRCEIRITGGRAHISAIDQADLDILTRLVTVPGPRVAPPRPVPVDVRHTGGPAYRAAVRGALDRIAAGELRKVILSRVVELSGDIDLAATYAVGRRANTPARSFLLRMGGLAAAGFSPEVVASVRAGGRVVTQPLAGTRALSADEGLNDRHRADLLSDVKEIYEHAISVKIGHDELLTVCEPDSVHVRDLMNVTRRGTVQHLASRVAGRLAEGRDCFDALTALFPAVTASGVPKPAAFAAIRHHEDLPRGPYGGAVVTVDESGELDAALVLRTVFRQDGRTWLRAGAGIVAQSTPDREFEETCEKLDSVARFLVPAADSAGRR